MLAAAAAAEDTDWQCPLQPCILFPGLGQCL